MLNFEEKISFLENYLLIKNDNYADFMKQEIYFYFFENENPPNFLHSLNTQEEIQQKVDFVVSKMILHEHENGLENLIEYYF